MAGQGINGPFPFQTREYYDNNGDTNAAKGSTLTFEDLDKTLLFLSASVASASAAGAVLTSNVTSNIGAGAIGSGTILTAGTTFQEFVERLLVTYIEPTITNVQAWYNNSELSTYTYDVGDSLDIDEVRWSTTNDSPDGEPPQFYGVISASIEGTSYDMGSTTSPYTLPTTQTITKTSVTSTSVIISGIDKNNNPVSGTKTISFSLRNQFGGYGGTVPNDSFTAQALFNFITGSQTHVFDSNKAFNITCDGTYTNNSSNFTYIMYPSSYGLLSNIIQDGATPVLTAFTNLGIFTINNGYGYSYDVRIYKSNALGAFANGVTLAIT
jgi:hypothetical protein